MTAILLGVAIFLVYNANGREIDVGDSIPTRLAAGELARYHTASLDRVIANNPVLETWPSIVRAADGHYRAAYSVLPAIWAAGVADALAWARLLDLDAPRSLSVVAKTTASLITAIAVVLAFLTARRRASDRQALLVAIGLGLGTGLWPTVSQTLWQHETTILGVVGAVWLLEHQPETRPPLAPIGVFLGIAGMSRPQVAPVVLLLAALACVRAGGWRRAVGLWPLALLALLAVGLNLHWFGNPLGSLPALEARHPEAHLVPASFSREPWVGAEGLLVSPNRGLLVFSPIVLIALAGIPAMWARDGRAKSLRWFAAATLVQFALLSCYSVWWAGYTYGPRYVLDVLPLLVPFVAEGLVRIWPRRVLCATATVLLAWSIAVSAVGAFCYAAEVWNTDPDDVDLRHERLWDWHDLEIIYCIKAGPGPDDFVLFSRDSWRTPPRNDAGRLFHRPRNDAGCLFHRADSPAWSLAAK